jgi:sulfur relay (sulfurtransferase) complex TusBCD TusD component (DsrE family)
MSNALVILHAAPTAADSRALTAVRLSGALLADSKDVTMFLVEDGALLADPKLSADNPCRELFYELMSMGMQVFVCGGTLRKLGWEESYLLPGGTKGSMKILSGLMTSANEIVTF